MKLNDPGGALATINANKISANRHHRRREANNGNTSNGSDCGAVI